MPQITALFTAIGSAFGATAVGSFLTQTVIGKLLTSVALSALSQALAPKPRPPGIKTSQTMTGGANPCQFILGRYATAGYAAAPAMSHGKAGKTPNAYLTYVLEVSDQPVSALNGIVLDGQIATIGTTADPDYGLPILGDFTDRAWVKFYTGTQTTADAMLLSEYGGYPDRPWTSDMIGRGLGYAILTFRYDREVYDSLPSVRLVVDGIKLYDVRKDSTAGGSGAHRWNDTATWEFTRNPVVMIYNILRGITLPDGSIWGGTVPASGLPAANWIAAMNICDQTVTTGAGDIPRYTAGFEVGVDDEPAGVIDELLKACGGQIVDMGGIWKIRAGGPGLPVYFMTDEDIIATRPEDFDPFPGLSETFNGITATYPEPSSSWEPHEAPPRYNSTWETEDGGRRLVANLSLPAVTHSNQCQRLMSAAIKDHRRMRRHNLTLTPRAMALEPLDVLSWTSSRNGYTSKSFEVGQVADDLRGCCPQVAIREVDPTDYDWDAEDELPTALPPAVIIRPAAWGLPGFAVSGVSLVDGSAVARRPAIRLSWNGADLDDVEAVEWEVRRSGSATLVGQGSTTNVEAGEVVFSAGVLPGVSYEARARAVVRRKRSWSSWLSATAPNVKITNDDLDTAVFDAMEDIAYLAGVTPVATLPASGQLNQIVMLIPPGRLYRWDGSAWVPTLYAGIEPGSLDTAAFASSIRPVEIVSALPSTGNFAGRVAFLTTDSKVYRHTGSPAGAGGWTVATDGADLTANSITAGKIAAAAIGADQIAANAIRATKLLVSARDNLFPDFDIEDADFYYTSSLSGYTISNIPGITTIGQNAISIPASTNAEDAISDWFPVEADTDYRAGGVAWIATGLGTGSGILQIRFAELVSGVPTLTRSVTIISTSTSATTVQYLDVKTTSTEVFACFRLLRSPGGDAPMRGGGFRFTRRAAGELIVDGAITADKIGASAVVADKIAAGAIVASKLAASNVVTASAQIADAIIGTAKIVDLAVTTLKIGDNAVTIPVYSYTAGTVTVNNITTEVTIASVSLTREAGYATRLGFSCQLENPRTSGNETRVEFRLYRGSTQIQSWIFTALANTESIAPGKSFIMIDTNTAGGATTYTIKAVEASGTSGTRDGVVSKRTLEAQQFKK